MTMPMNISAANQPNAGSDFLSGGNAGVTVCSTGVNLGSIIQPFTGSPENGGMGFELPSRFNGGLTTDVEFNGDGLKINAPDTEKKTGLYLIAGGVAIALILAVVLIKRR